MGSPQQNARINIYIYIYIIFKFIFMCLLNCQPNCDFNVWQVIQWLNAEIFEMWTYLEAHAQRIWWMSIGLQTKIFRMSIENCRSIWQQKPELPGIFPFNQVSHPLRTMAHDHLASCDTSVSTIPSTVRRRRPRILPLPTSMAPPAVEIEGNWMKIMYIMGQQCTYANLWNLCMHIQQHVVIFLNI